MDEQDGHDIHKTEEGHSLSVSGAQADFPLSSFLFPLARSAHLLPFFPLCLISLIKSALICVICGSLFRADLAGETLIFPPAALGDLSKLGPDRIEVRWKPRSIPDGYFPVVEGYYVVYNHENLSLFFGPVPEEEDAIGTQNELTKIRSGLIRKNPALSSSTVGRIHIDFGEDLPVGENLPPPAGFKPVRVLSGNSTLELGQAKEGAELESPRQMVPRQKAPLPPPMASPAEADSPEGIPEDEPASTQNGSPPGAENNESSPESPGDGSPAEETEE